MEKTCQEYGVHIIGTLCHLFLNQQLPDPAGIPAVIHRQLCTQVC
jgi:hypothetical protein